MSFLITVGLFFTLNIVVFALSPCNTDIIQNIRDKNGCALGNVLEQTSESGPYGVRGCPEVEFPSTLRCVSSSVDKPEGFTAHVKSTYDFTDGSQTAIEYTQIEKDCGKVLEYDKNNTLFELHFVTTHPVAGYYRCSESGTGSHESGYCAVPFARKDDEDIEDAVAACRSNLEELGVSSMKILDPCTI